MLRGKHANKQLCKSILSYTSGNCLKSNVITKNFRTELRSCIIQMKASMLFGKMQKRLVISLSESCK